MKLEEALHEWAKKAEVECKPGADGRLQASFELEHEGTALRVFVEGADSDSLLQVFALAEVPIPPLKHRAVSELLTLINPGIKVGALELVPGERVRFRTGLFVDKATIEPDFIDAQVSLALSTLRFHLGALTGVLWTTASPAAALQANLATLRRREGEAEPQPPPPEGTPWLEPRPTDVSWARFRGTGPVRTWAAALDGVVGKTADATRGVFFIGPSRDACEDVARLAAAEARYRFAFIPEDEVFELTPSALESFQQLAPVMVMLQGGAWLAAPDAEGSPESDRERTRALHHLLVAQVEGFDPDRPVVFCSWVSNLGLVDERLVNVGAFDRAFLVPEPSPEARGRMFLDMVGEEACAESLLGHLAKVGKAVTLAFGTREGYLLAALHLKRLAERERRKLEFLDLIDAFTRGLVESAGPVETPEAVRHHVAVHEAGHAVLTILDSQGKDVPEFSTIIPSADFRGVVVASLTERHEANQRSAYADFRHAVRVSLAGRAAEELVFGPEQVGNGAAVDLQNATRQAWRAFTEWGFAPGMTSKEASRSNLAVSVEGAEGPAAWHATALVRRFLREEYAGVLEVLTSNRAFLDAVTAQLLATPVVDQAEMAELCKAHGVAVELER